MAVTILLVLAMAALSASVPNSNKTFNEFKDLQSRGMLTPVECGTDFPEVTLASAGDGIVISTPGFGSTNYAAGLECGWNLKAAEGLSIVLECTEVDLSQGDVLEVKDLPEHDLFRLAKTPDPFWYRFRGDGKVVLRSGISSAGGKGFTCSALALPALDQCLCGKKPLGSGRIVGGTDAESNEYPWSAHITLKGVYKCGATLISRSNAITAASCIAGGKVELIVGVNSRSSTRFPSTKLWVRKIQKHPLYHAYSKTNDIAILSFLPINWGDYPLSVVAPICLPDVANVYSGAGTVSGFGATTSGGAPEDVMSELDLIIITNEQCGTAPASITTTDRQTCGLSTDPAKDLCDGDTGNPFAVKNGDSYDFVGMVSHDVKCGTGTYPIHVFTQIAAYVPWILENIDTCGTCPRA